jgi:5'-nucleotidase
LLTNDDGIHSPGIRALAQRLAPRANLWAAAPSQQRSGTGHGITVRETLRARVEEMTGTQEAWSVTGLPADCVKLALLTLLPAPVDLVISGINEGSNLGTDTLYSGTVAAALEGAVNDLPAIAVSLVDWVGPGDFQPAAGVCLELVERWWRGELMIPPMSMLNVNVPFLPPAAIKGIRAARLGRQKYSDAYALVDGEGEDRHFQLSGERIADDEDDLSLDITLIRHGYVSVTPISADRTDHRLLAGLRDVF